MWKAFHAPKVAMGTCSPREVWGSESGLSGLPQTLRSSWGFWEG